MADALFDIDPAQTRTDDLTELSADQRRTRRQHQALQNGQHPLSLLFGHMPLHDQAAPYDEPKADGRRCGNCAFRVLGEWHNRAHPKCTFGGKARVSHGAATDCRAWWPACRDHQHESEATDA